MPALIGGVFGCLCCILARYGLAEEDGWVVGLFALLGSAAFYIILVILTFILTVLFMFLGWITSPDTWTGIIGIVVILAVTGALLSGGGFIIVLLGDK